MEKKIYWITRDVLSCYVDLTGDEDWATLCHMVGEVARDFEAHCDDDTWTWERDLRTDRSQDDIDELTDWLPRPGTARFDELVARLEEKK